eukprot:PLAT4374.2.p1 GENE.PLAT4374.2~~PLAT4374.2.p1  ORF type:complete len:597 (-),score=308.19 PLAT4374.2:127-1917(-)
MKQLLLLLLAAVLVTAQRALPDDNYCEFGSYKYMCAESCQEYYYCNGGQRGENRMCPEGTACLRQGAFDGVPCQAAAMPEGGQFGDNCWTAQAPDACRQQNFGCNGHGDCRVSGGLPTCDCFGGFTGDRCDVAPDNAPQPTVCPSPLDAFLLLDSSGSVTADGYGDEQDFSKLLLSEFQVSNSSARFGVIQFSTNARLLTSLTDDATAVAQAIGSAYTQGWTDMESAMNMSQAHFDQFGRPGVPKIIFLMTDGVQTEARGADERKCHETPECKANVIASSSVIKGKGTRIVAIGVGPGLDEDQLNKTATTPASQHVVRADSFVRLREFLRTIVDSTCTEVQELLPAQDCFKGGKTVTVNGRGYAVTGDNLLLCAFGGSVVQAEFVSASQIRCVVPPFVPPDNSTQRAVVPFRVSVNGRDFTAPALFTYVRCEQPDTPITANVPTPQLPGDGGPDLTWLYALLPLALLLLCVPLAFLCFARYRGSTIVTHKVKRERQVEEKKLVEISKRNKFVVKQNPYIWSGAKPLDVAWGKYGVPETEYVTETKVIVEEDTIEEEIPYLRKERALLCRRLALAGLILSTALIVGALVVLMQAKVI